MMMSLEGGFQDQNISFDEKCLFKKTRFQQTSLILRIIASLPAASQVHARKQ